MLKLGGLVGVAVVMLFASACAPDQPQVHPVAKTGVPSSQSPVATTPILSPRPGGVVVTIAACCTATVPSGWSTPKPSDTGVFGTHGDDSNLLATFQVVGTSGNCPREPASVSADASASSQFHVTGTASLTINGANTTVWFTAPTDTTTFHDYEFVDADVVVSAQCVDVGGAEYGVASAASRTTLEQIMETLGPLAS